MVDEKLFMKSSFFWLVALLFLWNASSRSWILIVRMLDVGNIGDVFRSGGGRESDSLYK